MRVVTSDQAVGGGSGGPPILVPELRDYSQINAELVRRLNLGQTHVRLTGVAGHRLLAAGLDGPWHATVDVEGNAGPELAAAMNAPISRSVAWARPPTVVVAVSRPGGCCSGVQSPLPSATSSAEE